MLICYVLHILKVGMLLKVTHICNYVFNVLRNLELYYLNVECTFLLNEFQKNIHLLIQFTNTYVL